MKALCITLTLLALCGSTLLRALTPREATKHIGESATVTGEVMEVTHFKGPKGVILYFGHSPPQQTFTASLKPDAVKTIGLDALMALKGKKVSINGTIREWKNKPQIEVTNASQIVMVKE